MISNEQLDLLIDLNKRLPEEEPMYIAITDALKELKERRECELRPATKKSNGLTIRQEYEKFLDEVEEFKEVMEIYMNMTASNTEEEIDNAIKNVGLEGFDVQTVVETLLYKMGLAGKPRIELQKAGLKKNTERDYYNE